MRQLRHPATIVATIALFIALGGGMAIAAGGLISGSKIKNHSIPAKKLTSSAITALTGAPGPQGLPGETGLPGPSEAYTVRADNPVAIEAAGKTIATLTLGSGSYVLMANTSISDTAHPENTLCELLAPNKTSIDLSQVSTSNSGGYPTRASVNLMGWLTTAGGGDVTEWCISDDVLGSASASLSRIVAIKVGSVTGTAGHFHEARKARASASH
jgi:hypothetical protein